MSVVIAPPNACPSCHRPCRTDALVCDLCGTLLKKEKDVARFAAVEPTTEVWGRFYPGTEHAESPPSPTTPRVFGMPLWWFTLLAGLLLAPVLTFTPLLQRMGWFLAALVHETGHTAMAWLFGAPAIPAIRLDGHAASVHGEPSAIFRGMVTAAILGLAWLARRHPLRLTIAISGAVLYPLLAFTGAREVLFLAGGHLGELAFAAWALHTSLSGGFSGSLAERLTHAGVGFYLVGRNVVLFSGLVWSAAARDWYGDSGSFGLANDLLRLARQFACPLQTVGLVMLGVAAIPPASALVRALRTKD